MSDLTNSFSCQLQQHVHSNNGSATLLNEEPLNHPTRGTNFPGSQSMATMSELNKQRCENPGSGNMEANQGKLKFREYQVVLTKVNDGFGFVLRGARINPATLSEQSNVQNDRIAIDERLMSANNLASLQYLDHIETGSVAQKAGLKRGDFLVSVNNQDVRLFSHENVVQIIRSSGDRVHLTIATPVVTSLTNEIYSSRTLTRVKPEPPKRDPTTTLTRNKSQNIISMSVAPQVNQQTGHQALPFDANKPLPRAPENQIGSASSSDNNRSSLANIPYLNSTTSLSSAAPDTQSISSISTVGSVDNQRTTEPLSPNNPNLDQSSSSTATLTTVATNKPEALTKSSSIHFKGVAMRYPLTQPGYQPAAVMTSDRQKVQEQVDSKAPVKLSIKPIVIAEPTQLPQAPPALPTSLPPPPPPLPNFSSTTEKESRLNQRRTSAPVTQLPNLDQPNRLLKKRESHAVVNVPRQPNAAAPICAVAAACAAAANSRLQRQQQKEKDETEQRQFSEQSEEAEVEPEPGSKPSANSRLKVPEQFDQDSTKEQRVMESVASIDAKRTTNHCNHEGEITKSDVATKREQARIMQSATLGRKSSAQIIQQPKQQLCQSQSQTLKAVNTPKRMSILDYEMSQLPPPPPVPAQQVVSTRPIPHDMKPNSHQHCHHTHPHNNIAGENLVHRSVVNRPQHELAQRQLQSQHQLILRQSQHLRQRQLLQERLMAQHQAQHRVCKHNHSTSADHQYRQRDSYLVTESTDVANHVHHHPQNHHKQHHQPISMEAQSYSVSQHHDQHNHSHASLPANVQYYHEQQQHINQAHRKAPSCDQYSYKAIQSTPYHIHRHSSHIQHDHLQILHLHHLQHQKLLQQQQQKQYRQYVDSMPFAATPIDR